MQLKDLRNVLNEDQQLAIEKLHNGAILVGGVGSGKTRTSLGYYYINHSELPLLVLTTAKKRDTKDWENESKLFKKKTKMTVDSWHNIQKYANVSGHFVIFDEQHAGGFGKWAKTFIKIARHNKWITLSATPADDYMQLWAHFVANGYFKNKTAFTRAHVVYASWTNFPKIDHYIGTNVLEKYRRAMYVVMKDRRTTVRHQENIWCKYPVDLYKKAFKTKWNVFDDKPIENVSELGYTIRRIVNSDEERIIKLYRLWTKHPRMIVFYNFTYELEMIRDMCKEFNITWAELNGVKHEEIPKSKKWLYLVQYNLSEAWNCTECDTTVFFSQTYSYKTLEQAMGRIDRLNTKYRDLYYYHLKSRSPIDLAISRALENKKTFNEKGFFK